MSVASAVIELDTKDSPVFVFRNAGNDQVNIVYRRPTAISAGSTRPTAKARLTDKQLPDRAPGRAAGGRRTRQKDFSMDLSDLIEAPAIMPALEGELQEAAAAGARRAGRRRSPALPEREIFDTILQRERLGSTGVGNGIAIPHGKLAGVKRITGVFARLETPVDFEALDDQPVDLVFLLLAPEGAGADHLKALSRIARVLRDGDTVAKIRGTARRRRHPRAAVGHAGLARGVSLKSACSRRTTARRMRRPSIAGQ